MGLLSEELTTITNQQGPGGVLPSLRPLAIVGSHPATRGLAPYQNSDVEIWLFNESPQKPEVYKRWDASFQMHKPEVYSSSENWVNKEHWNWLQQDHGDKTIWMIDYDPRVPNSKKYPLDEILEMVPYRYLRSTPAMALALAIYLGYQDISLYGSELSSSTEYGYQAVNYAFWIGFAHGRGIDLRLECWHNEFYNQPIYGYEGEYQISKSYYETRIEDLETAARLNEESLKRVESKMYEAMTQNKYEKVGELSLNVESLASKAGEAAGALSEARRYLERTNPISRQEYERVSAQAQIDGDKKKSEMLHSGGKAEYVWNVWAQTGRLEALEQLRIFLKEKTSQAYDMGWHLGVFRENSQYLLEYDNRITALGGQRAVSQVERARG